MDRTRKAMTSITAGHFVLEWYAALLAPLVPLFRERIGFSLAAAAVLGASVPIVAGLTQALFGLLSDRMRRAHTVVALSSVLGAIAISLLPIPRSYAALVVLFMSVSLSLAMFHPQGAAGMSRLHTTTRGRFMSVFNFGGSMGTFFGSMAVIPLAQTLGLQRFWLLALPGIALAALQMSWLASTDEGTRTSGAESGPSRISQSPYFRGYLVLVGNTVMTAILHNGVFIMLPLLFQEMGFVLAKAGTYLAFGSLAGAVGNIIGAELSDRMGRKTANIVEAAGTALSLVMFVLTGATSLFWFSAFGFFTAFTLSSNIVFAHELVANHRGFVTSSIMGLSWGTGGLITALLGGVAGHIGILHVFQLYLSAAAVLVLLAILLPSRRSMANRQPSASDVTEPVA